MPEDFLATPTWEEFEDWKLRGWEIPSSVCCIIRATNTKGKVKEYVYQKHTPPKNVSNNLSLKRQSLLSALKMSCATFHPLNHMSLINLEQFDELVEDYPELAQCYDFTYTPSKSAVSEEPIANTCPD